MSFLNIEIKAHCRNPQNVRNYLTAHYARFIGVDEQTDTYFNVPHGRLKLRQGQIENNLIYYQRQNEAGPKSSSFQLVSINEPEKLKAILSNAYGIMIVVVKKREIYYIDNVKFHIDEVPTLGSFVEIEAGNMNFEKNEVELKEQCEFYLKAFGIREQDLIKNSYSDMLADLPDHHRAQL